MRDTTPIRTSKRCDTPWFTVTWSVLLLPRRAQGGNAAHLHTIRTTVGAVTLTIGLHDRIMPSNHHKQGPEQLKVQTSRRALAELEQPPGAVGQLGLLARHRSNAAGTQEAGLNGESRCKRKKGRPGAEGGRRSVQARPPNPINAQPPTATAYQYKLLDRQSRIPTPPEAAPRHVQ